MSLVICVYTGLMGMQRQAFKERGMQVSDLGRIDGEILVFGGPYSNLSATKALIAEAAQRGIPASHCLCTGDVVAYCAHPAETLAAIRNFGCPVVAGNCEHQLAQGAEDCGCGFEEGSTCDALSAAWYAFADRSVGQADRDWMAGVPDVATFLRGGLRYAVLHGGATDVSRFLWPTAPETAFLEEFETLEGLIGKTDIVLAGHCGLAFARDMGGKRWINAGAIGMPPHDGRAETRFAVLNEHTPVFERLCYNAASEAVAMRNTGLTQGYDIALTTGIWPSEDALPPSLRR